MKYPFCCHWFAAIGKLAAGVAAPLAIKDYYKTPATLCQSYYRRCFLISQEYIRVFAFFAAVICYAYLTILLQNDGSRLYKANL